MTEPVTIPRARPADDAFAAALDKLGERGGEWATAATALSDLHSSAITEAIDTAIAEMSGRRAVVRDGVLRVDLDDLWPMTDVEVAYTLRAPGAGQVADLGDALSAAAERLDAIEDATSSLGETLATLGAALRQAGAIRVPPVALDASA